MNRFIVWPILTALYPVFSLWVRNYEDVALQEGIAAGVLSIIVAVTCFYFVRLFFKDSFRASVASIIALAFFFSFGHFFGYGPWYEWLKARLIVWRFWTLIPAWSFLCLYFLKKVKEASHQRLVFFFNVQKILLLSLTVGTCIDCIKQYCKRETLLFELPEISDEKPSFLPNIYYIILDAYGRADVLKEVLGYDNQAFMKSLKEK